MTLLILRSMATGVGPPFGKRSRHEDDEKQREQIPNPSIRPPRSSRQPHDVGHDCEFVKRPSSDLVQADCPVCLLVLREPYQVTCCGYSFCRSCIQRVHDTQDACPNCTQKINAFPNIGLKRTLYALRVYCSQCSLGCEWEGELGELDRHLNLQPLPEKLLEGCQFSEVECTLCLQPFQRHCLQAHQSDDCPKRQFVCQHCNHHEATFEEVTQSHWPMCPSFLLPCPNNCNLVVQRQELEHHIRQDCRFTLVDCDFHIVGCGVCLPRKDRPSHISENLAGHMSLLQMHICSHPGENVTACMGMMVGTIQKVLIENTHTRTQLHEAKEELRESQNQLHESHDQLRELHRSQKTLQKSHSQLRLSHNLLNNLHNKLTVSHEKLNVSHNKLCPSLENLQKSQGQSRDELHTVRRTVAQLQEKQSNERMQYLIFAAFAGLLFLISIMITASEQKLHAQELTVHQQKLESVMYTGTLPFRFTISEFMSKKNIEWYSPHFYTHTHGYKMCIRVYANGVKSGKGTHLSVYGYIMQGPYDDDLLWPFQGAITIQLLNQLEDGNHHTYTIDFTGTANPAIIGRLTSNDTAGHGWGTSTFLPHTQLSFKSQRNCQYLKNNQLQFQVSKATKLDLTSQIHRQCLKLESFVRAIESQVVVAPVEFILSDFEKHKNKDSVWISPAFYTHQRGYRMCLEVHTNGYGAGQGTHVSIYTTLMRGMYDSELKWPFRGAVTVQIVDQAGDKQHKNENIYDEYTPDAYAARVSDKERSLGWGLHQFFPHTSLSYNAANKTCYIQADSLRIQIAKVRIDN